jgi:hypothetical protein
MEALKLNSEGWIKTSDHVFWGEIAPCEHVVQIYEDDEAFLDLLTGFISGALRAGESVVVIATAMHLESLDKRLEELEIPISRLALKHQYIRLDAEKTLAKFMVNDWPDQNLFNQVVSELLVQAKGNGRKVRAFGEMVAILWAKGQVGATVRLEQLWNMFCETEAFCLFCAYPKNGFTQDASESLMHICTAHSKMVEGGKSGKDLFYRVV